MRKTILILSVFVFSVACALPASRIQDVQFYSPAEKIEKIQLKNLRVQLVYTKI